MSRDYRTKPLLDALKRLRVWEEQWRDLAYELDDPRGWFPDSELGQDIIDERDLLRRTVVDYATCFAGVSSVEANVWSDQPLAPDNPFNIDRVRLAVAIGGWFR